jgi:Na+/proline symporter
MCVVVIYTVMGGLKATFLTDFLHTVVALILLIYFSLAVLTNKHIGGVSGLYEKVKATNDYIPGNYEGSLLTLKSKSCKCALCINVNVVLIARQLFCSVSS